MTWARRRVVVVCAVLAAGSTVSGCKVLQRAAPPSHATTAAANALQPSTTAAATACPFTGDQVDQALGGRWIVTGLPSGGCSYTRNGRTVMVSTVPLPRATTARQAALARIRKACDPGSDQSVASTAFVCRQDALVEAATIAGDRLFVLCTAASTDPAQEPGILATLGSLVSRAR